MSNSAADRRPHLLIFRNRVPDPQEELTSLQRTELVRQWNDWVEGLMAQGKMLSGHPLEKAGSVISGKQGERTTDGPYAEAKEAVAGYLFLTTRDFAEAQAIARQCPSLPYGLSVEVRPVAAFSPVLPDLRSRPGKGE